MNIKTTILLISACGILLSCCKNTGAQSKLENSISRHLEQAIEVGEKYISDDELIRNIALTEGTDKAVKVYDELNHRADYEAFWARIEEADSLSRQITDTLQQQAVASRLMPYIERIIILADEIMP